MDVVAWLLGVCGVVGRLPLICLVFPCLAGVPVCFVFLRLLCRGRGAAISSRRLPPIKWAQRSDSLYVTIDVIDIADANIDLQPTSLKFSGKSGETAYEIELEFFGEVDPEHEDTKYAVKPRNVHFHIMKKDKGEEFWPRLLKDKTLEKTNVKLDWDRYVDDDEDEAAEGFDTSAMGPGAMGMGGGMGGMPGMGGMGGMPGMGGMGGAGGMDLSALMSQMGGAGGAGGAGGMDMASMMAQMGGAGGGMPDLSAMGGAPGEGADSDDDALPDLEEEEDDK